MLQNPDLSKPEMFASIITARRLTISRQRRTNGHAKPWFAEIGDVHGNGNLIIFTDGSISELKNFMKNQSGK
jgi:hypothetical protein